MVGTRGRFGHWEIDTLIEAKTKEDPLLLTLVERKIRFEIMLKIKQKSTDFVNQAMKQLYDRMGNQATTLFKIITSDNGSEIADIHELLNEYNRCLFRSSLYLL